MVDENDRIGIDDDIDADDIPKPEFNTGIWYSQTVHLLRVQANDSIVAENWSGLHNVLIGLHIMLKGYLVENKIPFDNLEKARSTCDQLGDEYKSSGDDMMAYRRALLRWFEELTIMIHKVHLAIGNKRRFEMSI